MIYIIILLIILSFILYFNSNTYKHNKGKIKMKNISRLKHNNYLSGIYLGYLENIKTGNALVERVNNSLIIHIENKDGLNDVSLNMNDIIDKKINIKPYHSQTSSIKNHGIDEGALFINEVVKSNDDEYIIGNVIKIKKSYCVLLTLEDNTKIELIFFNDPNELLK